VPPYYAEATAAGRPAFRGPYNISIRVTGTGAALATVRPPAPYQSFGYLYATGDPEVWVAGAQRWHPVYLNNSAQPVALFKVAFSPVTRTVTLTRLPVPALPGTDLAAVALSPDGGRLALATLTPPGGSAPRPGDVWLSVYRLAGRATAVSSREFAANRDIGVDDYSLSWLGDDRTLALGGPLGTVETGLPTPTAVVYADGASPGLPVIRTVWLSFPAATAMPSLDLATAPPQTCAGPALATGDGHYIICGGQADVPGNLAGGTGVGVWVFSAQTGRPTSSWDRHATCCAIDVYPGVLWASADGGTVVADGITQANDGAVLYVRSPDGHLRRIPWPGLSYYPDDPVNVVEPPMAW
jgi:hypothetical protein